MRGVVLASVACVVLGVMWDVMALKQRPVAVVVVVAVASVAVVVVVLAVLVVVAVAVARWRCMWGREDEDQVGEWQ